MRRRGRCRSFSSTRYSSLTRSTMRSGTTYFGSSAETWSPGLGLSVAITSAAACTSSTEHLSWRAISGKRRLTRLSNCSWLGRLDDLEHLLAQVERAPGRLRDVIERGREDAAIVERADQELGQRELAL